MELFLKSIFLKLFSKKEKKKFKICVKIIKIIKLEGSSNIIKSINTKHNFLNKTQHLLQILYFIVNEFLEQMYQNNEVPFSIPENNILKMFLGV